MAKVSTAILDGRELSVSLRLDETGQSLNFHLHKGEAWKRVSGMIGHVPFEGKLIFEVVPRGETEDADVRMRLCVPAGTSELPACVPQAERLLKEQPVKAAQDVPVPAQSSRKIADITGDGHPKGDKGDDPGAAKIWPGDEPLAAAMEPSRVASAMEGGTYAVDRTQAPKPDEEAVIAPKGASLVPFTPDDPTPVDPTKEPAPDEETRAAVLQVEKAQVVELGQGFTEIVSAKPPVPGEEERLAKAAKDRQAKSASKPAKG